jgi:DNA-binding MarR family transcriptional regulator
MSDLGERVVLSRTRVSRLVDDLVQAGLVAREANEEDRRSAYAVLLDAGRERLRAAAPVYLAGIEERFASHLTHEELEVVGRALWRVHEAHRGQSRPSR